MDNHRPHPHAYQTTRKIRISLKPFRVRLLETAIFIFHVIADALGNPVAISLTPGQSSDLGQAERQCGHWIFGEVEGDIINTTYRIFR
jgi:hypothetical protein